MSNLTPEERRRIDEEEKAKRQKSPNEILPSRMVLYLASPLVVVLLVIFALRLTNRASTENPQVSGSSSAAVEQSVVTPKPKPSVQPAKLRKIKKTAILPTEPVASVESAPSSEEHVASSDSGDRPGETDREAFMALIDKLDPGHVLVDHVGKGYSEDVLKVTVANEWHYQPFQVRLQTAQSLWKGWSNIRSPSKPDTAWIEIVDFNGNHVGGSNVLAGSMVGVSKE